MSKALTASKFLNDPSAGEVSYTPAGTGAVATTVQEKLHRSVYVFDFMTPAQIADAQSGSPVLDHTSAIQAALAAANGELILNHGCVFTYAGALSPNSNTLIRGYGATLLQSASNIKCFDLSDKTGVIIEGLTFDGAGLGSIASSTANTAITSTDTGAVANKNCVVKNCTFRNLYSWGVDFKGAGGGTYTKNVIVQNNYFDGMLDEGINLYYIENGIVYGNTLTNHKREAIKIGTSSRCLVSNNIVKCNGTSVVDFQGPLINLGTNVAYCVVSNNYTFQGTIGIGLEKGVSYTTVSGNVCESPSTMGIGVANTNVSESPCHHISITGNTCKGGAPINLVSVSGLLPYAISVTGNACETTDAYPCISANYINDVIVSGNSTYGGGAGKDGISISNTTHAVVTSNYITAPDQWGVDVQTTTSAIVSGNIIVNPNQAASIAYGGVNIDTTVTDATTKGNIVKGATASYFIGVYNRATNAMFDQNSSTGHTNAAQRGTGSGKTGYFSAVQLGVTNRLTASTVGSVSGKFEIFDGVGNSLGFVPVYTSIS